MEIYVSVNASKWILGSHFCHLYKKTEINDIQNSFLYYLQIFHYTYTHIIYDICCKNIFRHFPFWSLPPPVSPSLSPWTNRPLYCDIYSIVYIHVKYRSRIWEKTYTVCLSKTGLIQLIQLSLVASIFLHLVFCYMQFMNNLLSCLSPFDNSLVDPVNH